MAGFTGYKTNARNEDTKPKQEYMGKRVPGDIMANVEVVPC